MKLVVADTGPLLHIHQAGALHLFGLVGEVQVTPTVMAELRRHAPKLWADGFPEWLQLVHPSSNAIARAAQRTAGGLLDAGEAESLAYADETKPDMFVTDDASARLMADSLSVPARGSLGIVLFCAARGSLSQQDAEQHLAALTAKTTLWLSARVKLEAARALAEIFR